MPFSGIVTWLPSDSFRVTKLPDAVLMVLPSTICVPTRRAWPSAVALPLTWTTSAPAACTGIMASGMRSSRAIGRRWGSSTRFSVCRIDQLDSLPV
ncbi:Uncharacterised protein [Bordetella pertussis]|nr:Uncharacterised protein [Bordetella pertussis]CPJ08027.1 Uncharacterised protein [Bordetella pertussis]CPP30914.1 Uncharacterised protein [Bordetella pertussis]CPQ13395.1 Uncharacterised protein [Bordetella pertussis]CRE28662.1 Uncharacterised protein [Bordetella pertussis]